MKSIEFMAPVHYMRGNLSGRQDIEYDEQGGEGYDVPTGQKVAANNYQPRLIAKRLHADTRNARSYFQVRTKTSINMTERKRRSLAVMGGAGALYAALISDKTSQIYNDCVNVCPQDVSLRSFIFPILMDGLTVKDPHITIAGNVYIVNPWASLDQPNVIVSQAIIDKFNSVLGYVDTPYNDTATAALMAAFPAQWTTIRDYGFAHTALVPFINEDPMLVMSLIEGLGERWLIGDGTAYIQTDYYHNSNTSYELEVIFMQRSAGQRWPGIFGRKTENGSADAMSMWLEDTSNVLGADWRGKNSGSSFTITNNVRYILGERKGGTLFCGTYSTSWGSTRTTQCPYPDFLFAWGSSGSASPKGNIKMRYCKVDESGVLVRNYVPCKNPNGNDYGMLDIVNARWLGNANSSGSFNISEQPA